MNQMMIKTDNFYRALAANCPEIKANGCFSRDEMKKFSADFSMPIPGPVWENKAGRGVFALPYEYQSEPNMDVIVVPPATSIPNVAKAIPSPDQLVQIKTWVAPQPQPAPQSFVPEIDENYVNFGHYKDVDEVVKSRIFYPLYITGLSGNGKSTMVEQVCAKRKREMIRVNLNALSDEDQLIGSKTLVDGNVQIVEGPVLIAMRRGATLLVDEVDAGSANALLCLQPILEGKPYYFKLKNELIIPKVGFNIIATANTKGKGNDNGQFMGTNILNEAFLERFGVTFEQEYPSQQIERKIVNNYMISLGCLDEVFADTLAKWADAIRRTYDAGGVDEIMSTRRIIHIVKAFSIFKNKMKAVELCCNRFDDQTKQAFLDMFKAVSPSDEEPTTPITPMIDMIIPLD